MAKPDNSDKPEPSEPSEDEMALLIAVTMGQYGASPGVAISQAESWRN